MRITKLIIGVVLLSVTANGQSILNDSIKQLAFSRLNVFIQNEKSPEGISTPYLSYKKQGSLILGQPFNLYFLNHSKLLTNNLVAQTLDSIVIKSDFWLFPVLLNGTPIEILTLQEASGMWIPVSFGRCQFSRELSAIKTAWRDNTIILVESQTGDCFFSIKELGNSNLTPINPIEPDSTRDGIPGRVLSYKNIKNISQTIGEYTAQFTNLHK